MRNIFGVGRKTRRKSFPAVDDGDGDVYESIKLKYPPILNPLLKALGADLYALTMSVDAKDQANGTNDEEYTYFLGMNQELERHLREKDASRTEKLTEQKVSKRRKQYGLLI
ncbi:hypothetical protein Tco_0882298 [Tanacetum coccineum]